MDFFVEFRPTGGSSLTGLLRLFEGLEVFGGVVQVGNKVVKQVPEVVYSESPQLFGEGVKRLQKHDPLY